MVKQAVSGSGAAGMSQGSAQGQQGAAQGQAGQPEQAAAPETWQAWLEGQPEEQRAVIARLHEAETQGLKSALKSEREARGGLEKQLREIGKQLDEGSEARKQLEAAASELQAAQQRVAFYENAPGDLVNPKLAWLAAQEIGAFDQRGNVNWDAVKQAFPELFKKAVAVSAVNAGSGNAAPKPFDMNSALREAAGRNRI